MQSTKHKIIGQGFYGIVVTPPIECGLKFEPNSIGKISSNTELNKEYEFIMKIINSKIDTKIKEYLNKNNVFLCKLKEEDIPKLYTDKKAVEYFKDNKPVNIQDILDSPYYQLTMPYLGNTFDTYIEKYKDICSTNKQNSELIMTVDVFKKYMNSLKYLYEEIKQLNNKKIFHNDIKPNNIIYNENKNDLILIDYNLSLHKEITNTYVSNIKPFQEVIDRVDFINNVLLYFLKFSFNNKYIYDNIGPFYKDYKSINMKSPLTKKHINTKIINNVIIEYDNMVETILNHSMILNEKLDDLIENTDDSFCKLKIKMSLQTQRNNALEYTNLQRDLKSDRENMTKYDKKKGEKKKKKKKHKKNP